MSQRTKLAPNSVWEKNEENHKQKLWKKHGGRIVLKGKYNGYDEYTLYGCNMCDTDWETMPKTVVRIKQCFECDRLSRSVGEEGFQRRLKQTHKGTIISKKPIRNLKSLMDFECLACGNEWTTVANHVVKKHKPTGCPECYKIRLGNKTRLSDKEYKSRVKALHSDGIIARGKYTDNSCSMKFRCKNGHDFVRKAWEGTSKTKFLRCPVCSASEHTYSRVSIECIDEIARVLRLVFKHAENHGESDIKGLSIDGFNVWWNIGIEFHGTYWHRFHDKRRKEYKATLVRDKVLAKFVYLISIWEHEWQNEECQQYHRDSTKMGRFGKARTRGFPISRMGQAVIQPSSRGAEDASHKPRRISWPTGHPNFGCLPLELRFRSSRR